MKEAWALMPWWFKVAVWLIFGPPLVAVFVIILPFWLILLIFVPGPTRVKVVR